MTQDSNEIDRTSNAAEFGLSDAEFQRDQVLGGRYRVLSLLGKGGMGIVYRVEQIFLGKELALKTIDKYLLSDITIRRFQAEARAAFAVDHPNIISVNDFGLLDDQTPFLVMEIVNGETLGDRLKNRALTVDEAIPIFIQVCFGLAHAHESGVVHRDIKPNNIMLLDRLPSGTEGSVKILDFGIAKLTQHEGGEIQALTRTGEIFGSPLYMSPEQCTGGQIDHRSDIYSLGCVLFEALTGTPPFVCDNALSTMMMHQAGAAPSLKEASLGAEFPQELERVVQAMLAKHPANRYQNLGIAAHDLAAIKRGETSQLAADLNPKRVLRLESNNKTINMRRDRFYFLLVGIGLLSALITAMAMYFFQVSQRKESVEPIGEKTKEAPTAFATSAPIPTEETVDDTAFDIAIKHHRIRLHAGFASDKSLVAFKRYKEEQSLEVHDRSITDQGIGNLKGAKILDLGLRGCNIKSVDNIVQLPYLQNLDLSKTLIDDSAIAKLAKLKMLYVLNLEDCKISEKALLHLISSTSLREVILPNAKYSRSFINELRNKMPQCLFSKYDKYTRLQQAEINSKTKDEYPKCAYLASIAAQANPASSATATFLSSMGAVRMSQGRAVEARKLMQRSTEIVEKNGDLKTLAEVLAGDAALSIKEKDFKKAIALSDRALTLFHDTLYHDDPQLLTLANVFSVLPMQVGDYSRAIAYCKKGLDLMKQFPPKDQSLLPIFNERIGWCYYLQSKPHEALPFVQRYVDLARANQTLDPNSYARALIELGNCLPDKKDRKLAYDEGLNLLDTLKLPEELNLKEHYSDACGKMAAIYDEESNPTESIKYLRKALAATLKMRHPDDANRKENFGKALVAHLKQAGYTKEAQEEASKLGLKE